MGWRIIALVSAGSFLATACTSATTDSDAITSPPAPATAAADPAAANAPDTNTVRIGSYDWARAPIGAGGFVTGIVSATDGTRKDLRPNRCGGRVSLER